MRTVPFFGPLLRPLLDFLIFNVEKLKSRCYYIINIYEYSTRKPDKNRIRRIDTEPVQAPVTHIIVTDRVIARLTELNQRAQGNFHDLVIFFGQKGQRNSPIQMITSAEIVQNPLPHSAFENVNSHVIKVRVNVQQQNPEMDVLGIGSAVGVQEDVAAALNTGYRVYYASGLGLEANRSEFSTDFSRGMFYVQDSNQRIIPLPAGQLYKAIPAVPPR